MPDIAVVWNIVLTGLVGAVLFFVKAKFAEVDILTALVTKTREEIARERVTRTELDQFTKRMETAFFRLEDKIDRVLLNGGK
jgi:uncharacterized membrane protein